MTAPPERPTDPPGPAAPAVRRISWQAASEQEATDADYLVKAFLRMSPALRAALLLIVQEVDPMG